MTCGIITACLLSASLLTACAKPPSQGQYGFQDVGQNAIIMFGRVVSEREVGITGQNTGGGAAAGAIAGGLGGSAIGQGNGSLVGLLAGAVIGGIAGHMTEQALADRQGIEYIITYAKTGMTSSVVQNIAKTDEPIAVGECVMVQFSGTYQRVLPAPDDAEECALKRHHKKKQPKPDE
jgi:outer membrane lipoprotein SlyB